MKVNPLNDKGDEENREAAVDNQSIDAAAAVEEVANSSRVTNKRPRKKIEVLVLLLVLLLVVFVLAVTLPLVLKDYEEVEEELALCGVPPDNSGNGTSDENLTHVPYDWNCSEVANVTSIYETSLNGMAELLKDHKVPPEHLTDFENMSPTVQEDDFNVSSYFDVLEYLSLPDDTVLNYVYVFNGMGGFPLLYVRKYTDESFATAEDLIRAKNCSSPWTCPSYLDEIIAHDSPQGFLQFVILDVMGDQFYLFWHDNYNDYKFITSSASVEEILQQYPTCEAGDGWEGRYGCFETKGVEMARSLDVTPAIQCNDNMVQVGVILFTEWGGFVQRTYNISRGADAGDRIVGKEQEVLVPFDIGIAF